MNASTKLGLLLLLIFTTCLFALILQLIYLLQRKRSFRQTSVVNGGALSNASDLSNSHLRASPTSKELLLYFFCCCSCKNKPTRVEPSSGVPSMTLTEDATAADSEEEEDELEKWNEVYGHSMVLYTIREGEREGVDSVGNSSGRQSEAKSEKRVSFRDGLSGRVETVHGVAAVVVDVEGEEATPFSTPCASSGYFTPSPSSPDRDDGNSMLSSEKDDVRSSESDS